MGNRDDSDWSLETGPTHIPECRHCGRDWPDSWYCPQCHASGAAETHKTVHTGYDAGDGAGWGRQIRADGGHPRRQTDWRVVGASVALAACTAAAGALAIGVVGSIFQPGLAAVAAVGLLIAAALFASEVIAHG